MLSSMSHFNPYVPVAGINALEFDRDYPQFQRGAAVGNRRTLRKLTLCDAAVTRSKTDHERGSPPISRGEDTKRNLKHVSAPGDRQGVKSGSL